jgi:hypothetical protein
MTGRREYQREVERLLAKIRNLVSELERRRVRGAALSPIERRLGQTREELAAIVSRTTAAGGARRTATS